jgi:hypothetical protein
LNSRSLVVFGDEAIDFGAILLVVVPGGAEVGGGEAGVVAEEFGVGCALLVVGD